MDARPNDCPCSWAAPQAHPASTAGLRLADCQSSRQPTPLPLPCFPLPASQDKDEASEAEVRVLVRRTFIELVAAPPRTQALRRAQSDSALGRGWTSDRPTESLGAKPLGTSEALHGLSDASTAPSDHEETMLQQWCEMEDSHWVQQAAADGMPCFWDPVQMGEAMPIAYMAQCMPTGPWMPTGFEETGAMPSFPLMHVDAMMSWQWAYTDPCVAGGEALAFEQAQPTPSAASSGSAPEPEEADWAVEDEPYRSKTTVLLRNLPTDLTRTALLELLEDEGFDGAFDFVYLPMDFGASTCLGYALVNFVSPSDAQRCWQIFSGYSDWSSDKVCDVTWCEPCQGWQAQIDRYRNSPVMHKSIPEEWKPLIFKDGARLPFPPPTKSISAPKLRRRAAREG